MSCSHRSHNPVNNRKEEVQTLPVKTRQDNEGDKRQESQTF